MKCIILAAGRGSRLNLHDGPKPLTKIDHRPLIYHVIRTAVEAGINEFIIVTGFHAEKLESYLQHCQRLFPQLESIEIVRNPHPEEGIFSSLIKGMEANDSNQAVIVTMADHLHATETFSRIHEVRKGNFLVIDQRPPPYIDLEEATKVLLDGNIILKLGKRLEGFHAIDTGLFRFEKVGQNALLALNDRQHCATISDALNSLIARNDFKLLGLPINGKMWIDIDTPADLSVARHLIRHLA